MPHESVRFISHEGSVVHINDKAYAVHLVIKRVIKRVIKTVDSQTFFANPAPEELMITVDDKNYPLAYKGWKLCDDLKYRKGLCGDQENREDLKSKFAFSGPYSNFSPK